MAIRVTFTPRARADLRGIMAYIARDSDERARTFGKTLAQKALSIGEFPEMGQIVPEFRDPSIRQIIHGQ